MATHKVLTNIKLNSSKTFNYNNIKIVFNKNFKVKIQRKIFVYLHVLNQYTNKQCINKQIMRKLQQFQ